ncbi:MmgE/PrpD family protein [Acuticoccus sp.]|uniref:MmgE/PrpD family protein n=1 Tax=Acuticoccus sp. TaxID=1904378 RepID=UPI003B528501
MAQVQLATEAEETTRALAAWIAGAANDAPSPSALAWARHALLDWLAVTIAGTAEPVAEIVRAEHAGRDDDRCTLIGTGKRARPADAALVNGTTGHALDYDDVNAAMMGHPTAAVAPAVLALAELEDARGDELLAAIVVGHEVCAALGAMVGREHYERGFHATGTVGTFGAAAACAALLKLDADRTEAALGLAATQAAGLKAMFGTMAKPFHAGRAAMSGLMAARLAARGLTAREGAVTRRQGFAATQSSSFAAQPVRPDPGAPFAVEATLFKYHAACYLTHSAIEAVRTVREREGLSLDGVARMTIYAPHSHRDVCDILEPGTGLEVKFSIRHLAALALDGADTADLALYTDAVAQDPRLGEARARIAFEGRELAQRHAAAVAIETTDGRTLVQECNVGVPADDVPAQWERLCGKARTLAAPILGAARTDALIEAVDGLEGAPDLRVLMDAAR